MKLNSGPDLQLLQPVNRRITLLCLRLLFAPVLAICGLAAGAGIAAAQQQTAADSLCPKLLDFALMPDGIGTPAHNINRDVVSLLEKETGCRIRIVEMPFARANEELKAGTIHMSGRYFETPERRTYLWFAHFQRTKTYEVHDPAQLSAARLGNLVEDREITMGVVRGFSHGEAIDGQLAKVRAVDPGRIIEFRDRETMFEAFLARRVDVVFLPSSVAHVLSQAYKVPDGKLAFRDPDPGTAGRPGGLVLSKAYFSAEQARGWQDVVSRICRRGDILRIFKDYFPATDEDLACSMDK